MTPTYEIIDAVYTEGDPTNPFYDSGYTSGWDAGNQDSPWQQNPDNPNQWINVLTGEKVNTEAEGSYDGGYTSGWEAEQKESPWKQNPENPNEWVNVLTGETLLTEAAGSFAGGYTEGYGGGYTTGYEGGYNTGYEGGYDTGYGSGYGTGYGTGMGEGRGIGYNQGMLSGGLLNSESKATKYDNPYDYLIKQPQGLFDTRNYLAELLGLKS